MAITIVGTSGVSAAALNGVSQTLTFAATAAAGDIALVFNVCTRAVVQGVTSSAGTAYTTLASGVNGNLGAGVWYRVCNANETTVTCSGSANASDSICCACFLLRGATPYRPNVSSAGTGTSSQPNSPAVIARYVNDAVFSIVAALSNTAAVVTAPSGYTSLISTGASDTRAAQLGMSVFLSTGTAISYDPTAYSSFTSAVWIGFTVSIGSTDPYTAFDLQNPTSIIMPSWMDGTKLEVVGY